MVMMMMMILTRWIPCSITFLLSRIESKQTLVKLKGVILDDSEEKQQIKLNQ